MAKENLDTKAKPETPFRKFERLAKKIVAIPKDKVQKREKRSRA